MHLHIDVPKRSVNDKRKKTMHLPHWLPIGKIGRVDITPVAWFPYCFDELSALYNARVSVDRKGGGAGPVRTFLIRLSNGGVAAFSSWEKKHSWETEEGEYVDLSLHVNGSRVVSLEEFEEVMAPLGVPADKVIRQGAWKFHRQADKP